MRIIFLGTGASHGIPVIGCKCNICLSTNSKDKRLRSSVFIETKHNKLLIDAGPDFRQQVLRENIIEINAVLLTHEHKDHTAGLDDIRAFNYLMKKPMPIYAEERVLKSLKQEYSYVFSNSNYLGIPKFDLQIIRNNNFNVNVDTVIPIRSYHGKLPIFGFRISNFAYITDAKTIPDEEQEKLKNLDVLVVNTLCIKEHFLHMNLDEAICLIKKLKPKVTYLTHISHRQISYLESLKTLPPNVFFAYDGLAVDIKC